MPARIEISHGTVITDNELEQLRNLIRFSKNIVLDTSSEPFSLGIEKISQEFPHLKILTGCLGNVPKDWIWYPGWLEKIDNLPCINTSIDIPSIRWHLWLRRPRPERLNLVRELQKQELLGTGEIVFPHNLVEIETTSSWSSLSNFLTPWDRYKDFILDSLDIQAGLNGALYPNWELRQDRALELVSETEVSGSQIFFSEKTWKPLRAGQLFLIWGQPGLVDQLRKLGFNVFDQYIDHSYDLEIDNTVRLKKCVTELKRLILIDDHEWQNIWINSITDRRHNQMHLRQDWKKYLDDKIKDN